ncbi:hypothetical protein POTOM_001678 [Populus tomentosa]|uniref:RING-type E3 ubiquitin transferase n=1 Tax=Populus tomentosa TaxID=118781 RepID=A0A8X8IWF3_POPTO|nr:hypothetical protein POTOM_001678 [Populus tomentosa]
MGFFSIYTRKFSVNPSSSSSSEGFYNSHRQRGTGTPGPASTSSRPSRASTSSRITRGLDPQVVNSLPVYSYYHGNVKYQVECAICLGEFEEKEAVKMIPECHHVFHLQCIDTWLAMHVTCPVCRGAHFVHEKGGGNDGLGVIQERVDQGASQPDGDTSLEVRGELIALRVLVVVERKPMMPQVVMKVTVAGKPKDNSCFLLLLPHAEEQFALYL